MIRLLAFLGILALSAALTALVERRRFRRFWDRGCTGGSWKAAFPEASKSEIRDFLEMFVSAFAFRRLQGLKFEPTDRVMEIYRTRYPSRLVPDSLELEMFVEMARRRYGVDLVASWHEDITLGELFERASRRVA